MKPIPGTTLRGDVYHLNIRIPKPLREVWGGPTHITGSIETRDWRVAERRVRAVRAFLDQELEDLADAAKVLAKERSLTPTGLARVRAMLAAKIPALPAEQRALIRVHGDPLAAMEALRAVEQQARWMQVGGEYTYLATPEIADAEDEVMAQAGREAADAAAAVVLASAAPLRDALVALGAVPPPEVPDMRTVFEDYCRQNGFIDTATTKNATRAKYAAAVRRFHEFSAGKALADLTTRDLALFSVAYLSLPASTSPHVRNTPFNDAIKIEDGKRIAPETRDQVVKLLKTLMRFAVKEDLRAGPDPWASYTPVTAKGKISAAKKETRHTFTRAEVKSIIAATRDKNPETLDYWAPLFGAHHGLRVEEICQLRIADVHEEDGILCMRITDEGEGQKVKNNNTLRTIPVHSGVIAAGFSVLLERRRAEGGNFLFKEVKNGTLKEVAPDGYGRIAPAYVKRFSNILKHLKITGYRIGTHSFRYAWTDMARDAGIPVEHRRVLAGRDPGDPVEAAYGKGYSMAVLQQSLEKLRPLD